MRGSQRPWKPQPPGIEKRQLSELEFICGGKMKKRSSILIICLSLILIFPGLSKAEKFGVKLSGGMNYLLVGDVNEGVKGVIDSFRDSATVLP